MTDRQREILRLIAEGYTTREIATRLAYSTAVIKQEVRVICDILQAKNRPNLVYKAIQEGVLTSP